MGILDLHADELQSVATNTRVYTPARQEPAFSIFGLAGAVPRGVVAGIGELGASAFDLAAGFYAGLERDRNATPAQRKEFDARGTLDMATDFRSEFGQAMRAEAQSWMPDPLTSHSSATMVADFARLLGKVAAVAPFTGPLGAAAIVGAEEGFTASDKLAAQGVDFDTRSKVGTLTAAATAGSFALPIAGGTVAKTAALAIGGGPAAYIAQQAATRAILKAADYTKLAEQYDPFDPVGLALSTLLPAGFGALGMRAASRARAAKSAADAAKAERDFMAGPVPSERSAVSAAVSRMADEATVDAARVNLLGEVSAAHRLTPASDLAGAAAHDTAMARAMDQMNRNEPVRVADSVLPHAEREANFRAWFGDSKMTDAEGAPVVVYHGTAGDFDAHTGAVSVSSDPGTAAFYAAKFHGDAVRIVEDGGNIQPVYIRLENPKFVDPLVLQVDRYDAEFVAAAKAEGHDGLAPVGWRPGDAASELVVFDPKQIKSAIGNSGRFDPNSGSLTDPRAPLTPEQFGGKSFAEFVAKVNKAAKEAGAESARAERAASKAAREAAPVAPGDAASPPPLKPSKATADGLQREQADAMGRAADDLELSMPDMPVRLDGMDEAIPLRELMAQVRAEAARDLEQGPLVETAAACALRAAG